MNSKGSTWKLSRPFVGVLICFLISRVLVVLFGVTFDDSGLSWFYQFLEIDLLEHDLLSSLWHLHAQPPLLNLLAGVGLKISLPAGWWFWRIVYWGLGLAQVLLLFDGMRRLGAWPWFAACIVSVYMVSPAVILFENWLFYPYPSATLLVLAAWLLIVYQQNPQRITLLTFFLFCALLPLLRSMFHLFWLLSVAALLILTTSRERKRMFLYALIPIVLVTGWYTKNLVLFDSFSGSSWMGMNFARATVFQLPEGTREDWIEQGILSEISSIGPFSPLERYESIINQATPTGIAGLDNPYRGGVTPNYNHISYIEISNRYERDAWTAVREAPVGWLTSVPKGFLVYFRPPQEFALRSSNQSSIEGWEGFYDRWVNWQIGPSDINKAVNGRVPLSKMFLSCCYLWVLLYLLALALGIHRIWSGIRGSPECRARMIVYVFLVLNIVYITLVGNIFEYGENNRFRFMADPLVLMVVVAGVSEVVKRIIRGSDQIALPRSSQQ